MLPLRLGWIKFRRFLAAASGPIAFALLTVVVAVMDRPHRWFWSSLNSNPLFWAWIVGVFCWWIQSLNEYRRRTHDPSLALRYQDFFDGAEMRGQRPKAAASLRDYRAGSLDVDTEHGKKQLEDTVDDILDVFEDIGFCVAGDQISPEAAHHFFYHWLRGYWCSASGYVQRRQIAEPTNWDHVAQLFEMTHQVERWEDLRHFRPSAPSPSDTDLRAFLDEEIRLPSRHGGEPTTSSGAA